MEKNNELMFLVFFEYIINHLKINLFFYDSLHKRHFFTGLFPGAGLVYCGEKRAHNPSLN